MSHYNNLKENFLQDIKKNSRLKTYYTLINDAIVFGEKKHSEQVKKYDQTPYFFHCISVASNLLYESDTDKNLIIAALLHDTVEDTDTLFDEINEYFDSSVEILVKGMTKAPSEYKNDWGKERYYNEGIFNRLKKASENDYRVWKIKLSECIENMKDFHLWAPIEEVKDYLWEAEQIVKFTEEYKIKSPLIEKLKTLIFEYHEFIRKKEQNLE
jgi:(p)ppGpp synthase/HD superfamily hydrolase